MLKPILEIVNLSKSFDGLKAVNNVSFSVHRGTIASVIGPNGAGKTSLFNLINGFIRQDSGSISYNSDSIDDLAPTQRAILGIGRLWQDIRLFNNMTVMENLLVAKNNHPGDKILNNFFAFRNVEIINKFNLDVAEKVLEFIHLAYKRNSLAQDLSYGQQKLLTLGRLIMNDADLLLLDEPLAGINPQMINNILSMLQELKGQGKTIFMIEHNLPKALSGSDIVYVMNEGKIELSGTPSEISKNERLREIYLGV